MLESPPPSFWHSVPHRYRLHQNAVKETCVLYAFLTPYSKRTAMVVNIKVVLNPHVFHLHAFYASVLQAPTSHFPLPKPDPATCMRAAAPAGLSSLDRLTAICSCCRQSNAATWERGLGCVCGLSSQLDRAPPAHASFIHRDL